MTDYIELPGGRIKERPKAHIRGGFGKADRAETSAESKVKRDKEELMQELGQVTDEPEEQNPSMTLKGANPNQEGRTWSFPAEDDQQDSVGSHRSTGGDLRGDLEVRNQPDPRKFSSKKGPKHFV